MEEIDPSNTNSSNSNRELSITEFGGDTSNLLKEIYDKDPKNAFRQQVLIHTLEYFVKNYAAIKACAEENHKRWEKEKHEREQEAHSNLLPEDMTVEVVEGDWGEIALEYTKIYAVPFVVLNMANAETPGGGYLNGRPAQEENIWRRTDCHFSVPLSDLDKNRQYLPEKQDLINGDKGKVYLDCTTPRICIKGKEETNPEPSHITGYELLDKTDFFMFYELRAAAIDLRNNPLSSESEQVKKITRQKIAALLDTLIDAGQRHVILGAFGCGAFKNKADMIADLFKEELEKRQGHFKCVVFAIHYAGYGPRDNYDKFKKHLHGISLYPTISRTNKNVFLAFQTEAGAKSFIDTYGGSESKFPIPVLKDSTLTTEDKNLPLIDNKRIPGKFVVRLPYCCSVGNTRQFFYDSFRKNNDELAWLPEFRSIPEEVTRYSSNNTSLGVFSPKEKAVPARLPKDLPASENGNENKNCIVM